VDEAIDRAEQFATSAHARINQLAHGQDITTHDWPQIVRLARRIQSFYVA
jgi:hypothetical protein